MPPAPGLFSTMTFWPSTLAALCAMARITASVLPPAGQGQMYFTGRAGKAWARPSEGRASAAAAPSTIWRRRIGVAVIGVSLGGVVGVQATR
jgi:hypothetical protein